MWLRPAERSNLPIFGYLVVQLTAGTREKFEIFVCLDPLNEDRAHPSYGIFVLVQYRGTRLYRNVAINYLEYSWIYCIAGCPLVLCTGTVQKHSVSQSVSQSARCQTSEQRIRYVPLLHWYIHHAMWSNSYYYLYSSYSYILYSWGSTHSITHSLATIALAEHIDYC
jgi:hypothetical protein